MPKFGVVSLIDGQPLCDLRLFTSAYKFSFHHDCQHVWAWCTKYPFEPEQPEVNFTNYLKTDQRSELRLIDIAAQQVCRTIDIQGEVLAINSDDSLAMCANYVYNDEFFKSNAKVRGIELALWDLATGQVNKRFVTFTGPGVCTQPYYTFSNDGSRFVLSQYCVPWHDRDNFRVWDIGTGMLIASYTSEKDPGQFYRKNCLRITPDNQTVMLTAGNHLYQWRLQHDAPPLLIMTSNLNGDISALSPDGRVCCSVNANENRIYFYSTSDGKLINQLNAFFEMSQIRKMVPLAHGTFLACISNRNDIRIWDMQHGRIAKILSLTDNSGKAGSPQSVEGTDAILTPDGRDLLVACCNRSSHTSSIVTFDMSADGTKIRTITLPGIEIINRIALTPDGSRLMLLVETIVKGARVTQLRMVNPVTGETLEEIPQIDAKLFPEDFTYSQNGSRLYILYNTSKYLHYYLNGHETDKSPSLFAIELHTPTPKVAYKFNEGGTEIFSLTLSPDQRYIAFILYIAEKKTSPVELVVLRASDGQEIWCKDSSRIQFSFTRDQYIHPLIFSSDSKSLILLTSTSSAAVYNVADGTSLGIGQSSALYGLTAVTTWGTGMNMRLMTGNNSGVLALWRLPDLQAQSYPQPLVAQIGSADGRWLMSTPTGYYNCALEADNAMIWRLNGQVFPFDSFSTTYRRPDIVQRALAGETLANIPPIDATMSPPVVSFTSPAYGTVIGPAEKPVVGMQVNSGEPIARLELTVNGQPLPPALAEKLVIPNPTRTNLTLKLAVPAPPGAPRLRIRAVAYDTRGFKSAPVELALFRPGAQTRPGTLWVLAVGINQYAKLPPELQLKSAVTDAAALAELFKKQNGNAAYAAVNCTLLTDAAASLSGLKLALRELKDKAEENDTVILCISGHAVQDADGVYYFATAELDLHDLPGTALNWQDFQAALREVRAKRVLVLAHTCQSAGIVGAQTASADLLAEKLNKQAHRLVFVACRGNEESFERDEWGHGAFTKAILDAFAGQADADKDGQITFQELKDYVISRVEELTKGRQHPQLPFLDQFEPEAVLGKVVSGK